MNAGQLREGWEDEPIDPPHPWLFYLVAFFIGLCGCFLQGCAAVDPLELPAEVRASCPPLTVSRLRTDADALTRRVAELEGWFDACRTAALTPARHYQPSAEVEARCAPLGPPAWITTRETQIDRMAAIQRAYAACRDAALLPQRVWP